MLDEHEIWSEKLIYLENKLMKFDIGNSLNITRQNISDQCKEILNENQQGYKNNSTNRRW